MEDIVGLIDLDLNYFYDKTECDVAQSFYLPCMREANRYDRRTGYFSSGIYVIAWAALQEFIHNEGKIRILCSPNLSNEDKIAIKEGYESQNDNELSQHILSDFNKQLSNPDMADPAKLLACLVAKNILDIHIAIMSNGELYHDKVGVFEDEEGNRVGFRGPMNETYKGLAADGNGESIDVFWNWSNSEPDVFRANMAKKSFEQLWNNDNPNVCVYDLPSTIKQKFLEISQEVNMEELLYKVNKIKPQTDDKVVKKELRKHQKEALDNWNANGRRGLFEHATGSGKTYTAICAIRDSLGKGELPLILVPSVDLLSQWQKELKKELADISPTIFLCGAGNSDWKGYLSQISNPSTLNTGRKYLILAVMATASSEEFLNKFRGGSHIFVVADEVHRLGSPQYQKIFSLDSGPRLGLSATPRRFGDPLGTEAIFSYFEGIVPPVYDLKTAIRDGVLTEYKYFPQTVYLTEDEQETWNDYTKKIRRKFAIINNSPPKTGLNSNKGLKELLIARARVIKRAQNKLSAALEIIQTNYESGQKWIIYCDNIEQIKILIRNLNGSITALEYHSGLDQRARNDVMEYFNINGGVLVSVKCLDEGVDIPSVSHAIILASSKNPREFIQRRGRLLRKANGKYLSYIYDLIVLPSLKKRNKNEKEDNFATSIVEGELARAILFGKGSSFPKCVSDLNNIAIEYEIDIDKLQNEGYDDEF